MRTHDEYYINVCLWTREMNSDTGDEVDSAELYTEDELVGTTTYVTFDEAKEVYDKYRMDGPEDDASLLVVTHQQRRLLRDVLAEAQRLNEDARQQVETRVFQGLHVLPSDLRERLNDEWESLKTIFNMVN